MNISADTTVSPDILLNAMQVQEAIDDGQGDLQSILADLKGMNDRWWILGFLLA